MSEKMSFNPENESGLSAFRQQIDALRQGGVGGDLAGVEIGDLSKADQEAWDLFKDTLSQAVDLAEAIEQSGLTDEVKEAVDGLVRNLNKLKEQVQGAEDSPLEKQFKLWLRNQLVSLNSAVELEQYPDEAGEILEELQAKQELLNLRS